MHSARLRLAEWVRARASRPTAGVRAEAGKPASAYLERNRPDHDRTVVGPGRLRRAAPDVRTRRSTLADRRRRFRALHERGCFVIPNPWDVGTTRWLASLGFEAVATTSAGVAFSAGLPDTAVGRDAMLAHIRAVVAATDLPVNADFEAGYADDLDAMAENATG
jgi:hypothetical protein